MLLPKNKKILIYILLFSTSALCIAYFIQYILGHQPCNLCLIERVPYFASIFLIFLIFFLNDYERIISIIISIFFIFGAVVSFYHFGIEQGFFNESLVCNLSSLDSSLNAENLLRELQIKKTSCKDVTFKLLGVSLATFNTIISLVLSAIMIRNIIYYAKN
jgi:disulfide bond formation protein DsbB|tara:strand:- start:170 stop:652 length:483 start_codon:yes stop_codon:yes gene_type:complete